MEDVGMPRPGGNPGLKKYAFTAAGEESNNCRLSFWVPQSMKDKLDALENRPEFVRAAIAKALEELP
jgi:hypothetical protein